MIRTLEGFGPYATAQLPASEKWSTASNVTIVAGGGRSGESDDNCARFDASLQSTLSGPLSVTAQAGLYKTTWGHAVRVIAIDGTIRLGSLSTTITRFDLTLTDAGVLAVTQTTGGVLLGTICATQEGMVPIATGGTYIEVQITLQLANTTAVQVRVRNQFGMMNVVATGSLLALTDTETFTTRTIGGALGTGSWDVADLYYTDGVPEATALAYKGQLIYNDGYLGDTHVEALYPTADGENLSDDNTPWVPDTGSVEYTRINEHPPDDDTSYVSATESGQTSSYVFQTPRQTTPIRFGRQGCCSNALPIYGIQWGARMRSAASGGENVAAIVRKIVGGTFDTDDVHETDPVILDTSYEYFPIILGRNPFTGAAWSFAVFFRGAETVAGDIEFGQRLL